jgi:hypothetical protein
MKSNRTLQPILLSVVLLGLTIFGVIVPQVTAQTTQDSAVFAIQRGYRTGYSDGYMAGYRDTINSVAKSYDRHMEYGKADRAYNKAYGSVEDYRDGYQQGFEAGYDTGFERRSFESSLPTGLKRRDGVLIGDKQVADSDTPKQTVITTEPGSNDPAIMPVAYLSTSNAVIVIPCDTELLLELQGDLSTESSREGDKFIAKVVSPSEIAGATVEGRIAKVLKPGRIKRRSELLLSFDRINISDQRWSNFSATLTEVLAVKGDNISRVDNEGTAVGRSSVKSDALKVGGATGAGLVTGAVIAGPAGAAVGAGVGAAFGVGAVVIERGKHIRLTRNQQLRVKTAHEAQIR